MKSVAVKHYRRCHICGETNSAKVEVKECSSCGKVMAKFYYFSAQQAEVSENGPIAFKPKQGEYRPIYGLTAVW